MLILCPVHAYQVSFVETACMFHSIDIHVAVPHFALIATVNIIPINLPSQQPLPGSFPVTRSPLTPPIALSKPLPPPLVE